MTINLLELGQKCSLYRRFLGITQQEVANEVGVSRKTISDFEWGKNDSVKIFLWYLINGFGIEENDLEGVIKDE